MSAKILAALAIFVVAFPSALATQHIVGGSQGWTLGGVNYTTWAAGETFAVGDTLLFKYTVGAHNVYVVSEADYLACTTSGTALTSGADVLTLTAGNHWYICGIPGHCAGGMALAVTVGKAATPVESPSSSVSSPPPSSGPSTSSASPPPPPPPPSSAPGTAFSQSHAWVVGVLGILMMMMMVA